MNFKFHRTNIQTLPILRHSGVSSRFVSIIGRRAVGRTFLRFVLRTERRGHELPLYAAFKHDQDSSASLQGISRVHSLNACSVHLLTHLFDLPAHHPADAPSLLVPPAGCDRITPFKGNVEGESSSFDS